MTTEMADSILFSRDGDVATITLNRPRYRNALGLPALERFEHLLDQLHAAVPRALILTASAPGFCSGIDLHEARTATPALVQQRVTTMHRVLAKLRTLPAPVVAAIDGVCAGLGCELAISADLRLATPQSRFSYPEVRVAVPSPAQHLVWLIGLARAQDMLLTARWVEAEEGARIGLVTRVVEDAAVSARMLTEDLLLLAPRAVAETKVNICHSIGAQAALAAAHHIAGVTAAASTADRKEALAAFAEKRPTQFTGS